MESNLVLPAVLCISGSAAVSLLSFGLFVVCHVAAEATASERGRRLRACRATALFTSHAAAVVSGLHWPGAGAAGALAWPAAGVALAGLLIGGRSLWPAILLSFFAAAWLVGTGAPPIVDALLAAAATVAALCAAEAIAHWLSVDTRLTSMRDTVWFSLAALAGGALSAALAVTVLWATGLLPTAAGRELAIAWSLGAAISNMIVAPCLLTWSYRSSWVQSPRRWLLFATILAATAALSYWVFLAAEPKLARIWYIYPLLICAAVAYQVRGASVALLIASASAAASASHGVGPFGNAADPAASLLLAWEYAAITAFAVLVLAAAADERYGIEALRQSGARDSRVIATAHDPIVVADDRGRIVSFNPAAERSFGYPAVEVIGRTARILVPEDRRSAYDACMERYHRKGERRIVDTTLQAAGRRKDGSVFPLDLSVAEWSSYGATFFTAIIHEQTKRVRAEAVMREREHRLATAIDATGGGVYEQAVPTRDRLYLSPQWLAILGYVDWPVRPENFDAWLVDQTHPDDRETREEAWRAFIEGIEPRFDAEVRMRNSAGRWIWVRFYAQATKRSEAGGVRRVSGIMFDVTDRRAAQSRAAHLARHDTLTGLSNRAQFTESLREAAAGADLAGAHAGLVLIDLDHFKKINDTLGHPVGDAVLRVVTDRIRASIRTSDTAARLGGDEFAVVVAGAHSRSDIEELARRLHGALSQPAAIDGKTVAIEVSIGFASYPHDAETVDLLMRNADLALYEAKRRGRNEVMPFHPPLAAAATHRSRIEKELREAIRKGELALHYQPQFGLSGGKIQCVEALVRWPREGQSIPPDEFIPIAEASGIIRALGDWVLSEAARQQAEWRAEGHDVVLAINVSPVEASAESFPRNLKRALADANLPGSAIELEITEGFLMHPEDPSVQAFLAACEELGIGLAIDDFGKGYSALSYLVNLPISKVKIDRSFVSGLADHKSATLIEGIISLGHRLEKRVVAEGVETQAQYDRLRQMGCDAAQGFFLSEPVDARAMTRLLSEQVSPASRPATMR